MTSHHYITLTVFLIFSVCGAAQNLVPNPGFEDNTHCPCTRNDLTLLEWFGPSMSYNRCSSCRNNKVPDNVDGQQLPYEGDGYTSVTTYAMHSIYNRSFLGVKLHRRLEPGTRYYASLRGVSTDPFWDNPPNQPVGRPVSNKLGIGVSTTYFETNYNYGQHGFPPVTRCAWTDDVMVDTVDWKLISGTFIADSAYEYLYVGNFFPKEQTIGVDPRPDINHIFIAWYFVDDVQLYEIPEPQVSNAQFCPGDTVRYSLNTEENVTWLVFSQGFVQGSAGNSGQFVPPNGFEGTLHCRMILSDTTFVWEYPIAPKVHQVPEIAVDLDFCEDSLFDLTALTDYSQLMWNNGATAQVIHGYESGVYGYRASDGRCADSVSTMIIVPDCHQEFYIPSAFTPDGDGINDLFFPAVNPAMLWKMHIYDRWGRLIRKCTNSSIAWDGQVAGKPAESGVYCYTFQVTDLDGNSSFHSGKINLIR